MLSTALAPNHCNMTNANQGNFDKATHAMHVTHVIESLCLIKKAKRDQISSNQTKGISFKDDESTNNFLQQKIKLLFSFQVPSHLRFDIFVNTAIQLVPYLI